MDIGNSDGTASLQLNFLVCWTIFQLVQVFTGWNIFSKLDVIMVRLSERRLVIKS